MEEEEERQRFGGVGGEGFVVMRQEMGRNGGSGGDKEMRRDWGLVEGVVGIRRGGGKVLWR